MLLKSINPGMASHLPGIVTPVNELVRLGQQLEKDQTNQAKYGLRKKTSFLRHKKKEKVNSAAGSIFVSHL